MSILYSALGKFVYGNMGRYRDSKASVFIGDAGIYGNRDIDGKWIFGEEGMGGDDGEGYEWGECGNEGDVGDEGEEMISGIIGFVLGAGISWIRNRSILWSLVHGILGWIYVLYWGSRLLLESL